MKRPRDFRWRRFAPVQLASYFLIRCVIVVVDILGERYMRKVGRLIGRLGYVIDAKHRRIAEKNVSRAEGLPRDPADIRRFVRRVYEHMGLSFVETLQLPKLMATRRLARRVRIEGRDIMDAALAERKGVVAVVAHLGNWELGGLACAVAGIPLTVIARPIENPYFDDYVTRLRTSSGAGIIPKYGAFNVAREILKAGEIVVILADQDARKSGVFVPFLGRPASTVRSAALLAIRHGAPIVPVNIYRAARDLHVVRIETPIRADASLPLDESVYRLTAAFTARFEAFVREHPDQWMWLHARWKTKPPGEPADEADAAPPEDEEEGEGAGAGVEPNRAS